MPEYIHAHLPKASSSQKTWQCNLHYQRPALRPLGGNPELALPEMIRHIKLHASLVLSQRLTVPWSKRVLMTGWTSCWWPSAVFDTIQSTSNTLMVESAEPVAARRPAQSTQMTRIGEQNSVLVTIAAECCHERWTFVWWYVVQLILGYFWWCDCLYGRERKGLVQEQNQRRGRREVWREEERGERHIAHHHFHTQGPWPLDLVGVATCQQHLGCLQLWRRIQLVFSAKGHTATYPLLLFWCQAVRGGWALTREMLGGRRRWDAPRTALQSHSHRNEAGCLGNQVNINKLPLKVNSNKSNQHSSVYPIHISKHRGINCTWLLACIGPPFAALSAWCLAARGSPCLPLVCNIWSWVLLFV